MVNTRISAVSRRTSALGSHEVGLYDAALSPPRGLSASGAQLQRALGGQGDIVEELGKWCICFTDSHKTMNRNIGRYMLHMYIQVHVYVHIYRCICMCI